MKSAVEQGVFNYQSKATKNYLILCWVCLIMLPCLIAFAFIIKGPKFKRDYWLGFGVFTIFLAARPGFESLTYKNSQVKVTEDGIESIGPTKKVTRIRFDDITSIKLYEEFGRWTWGEIRSQSSRIAIIRGI